MGTIMVNRLNGGCETGMVKCHQKNVENLIFLTNRLWNG